MDSVTKAYMQVPLNGPCSLWQFSCKNTEKSIEYIKKREIKKTSKPCILIEQCLVGFKLSLMRFLDNLLGWVINGYFLSPNYYTHFLTELSLPKLLYKFSDRVINQRALLVAHSTPAIDHINWTCRNTWPVLMSFSCSKFNLKAVLKKT